MKEFWLGAATVVILALVGFILTGRNVQVTQVQGRAESYEYPTELPLVPAISAVKPVNQPTFDVNSVYERQTQSAATTLALVATYDALNAANKTAMAPPQATPTLVPVDVTVCQKTAIFSQPVDDKKYIISVVLSPAQLKVDQRSADLKFARLFNTYHGADRVDAWVPISSLCAVGQF